MLFKKRVLGLLMANAGLFVAGLVLAPDKASADGTFWCDPGGGSAYCMCVSDSDFLPGGCWHLDDPGPVNCFSSAHC